MDSEQPDLVETTAPPPVAAGPVIPWGWVRALLSLPVWILVQLVITIPIMALVGGDQGAGGALSIDTPGIIFIQLGQLLSTVLVVWVFRRWIDGGTFVSLGFMFTREYARDLVAGCLCGIALISAIFLTVLTLGGLSVVAFHPPSLSLLILTVAMMLVATNEELYIRGYLLNNLMASANKYLVLLISSVAFAAFHISNPNVSQIGLVNIILAGLLLGIYYIHKRNLWFPIGLHFTWNLFQGGVYGSPISGVKVNSLIEADFTGNALLTGGEFGFEASLVTTVLLVAATLAVHLIYRPKESPAVVTT